MHLLPGSARARAALRVTVFEAAVRFIGEAQRLGKRIKNNHYESEWLRLWRVVAGVNQELETGKVLEEDTGELKLKGNTLCPSWEGEWEGNQ